MIWLAWAALAFGALLVVYEIRALFTAADDAISDLVRKAAGRHPIIPFLAGLVAGHLFWR